MGQTNTGRDGTQTLTSATSVLVQKHCYWCYDSNYYLHKLYFLSSSVTIRGDHQDEAVLCTDKETYDLKIADTSNSLLLVPDCVLPKDEGLRPIIGQLIAVSLQYHRPLVKAKAGQLFSGSSQLWTPPHVLSELKHFHQELIKHKGNEGIWKQFMYVSSSALITYKL